MDTYYPWLPRATVELGDAWCSALTQPGSQWAGRTSKHKQRVFPCWLLLGGSHSHCWRKKCHHSCNTDLVQVFKSQKVLPAFSSLNSWQWRVWQLTFFLMQNKVLSRVCLLSSYINQVAIIASLYLSIIHWSLTLWAKIRYTNNSASSPDSMLQIESIAKQLIQIDNLSLLRKGSLLIVWLCSDSNQTAQRLQMTVSKSLKMNSGMILNC